MSETVTHPTPTAVAEAIYFIRAAQGWLDDTERATAAGFDPEASAVMMLDRALEFLRGEA